MGSVLLAVDAFLIDRVAQPAGERVHGWTGVGIFGQARRIMDLFYFLITIDTVGRTMKLWLGVGPTWAVAFLLLVMGIWFTLLRGERPGYLADERAETGAEPWSLMMRFHRLHDFPARLFSMAMVSGTITQVCALYFVPPVGFSLLDLTYILAWLARLIALLLRACTPKPPRRRAVIEVPMLPWLKPEPAL